jgi:hypothetical protein
MFGKTRATILVGLQARILSLSLKTKAEVPMILYVVGMALITTGFWLAWHPLGWIFGGGALSWMAVQYEKISAAQAEVRELETKFPNLRPPTTTNLRT